MVKYDPYRHEQLFMKWRANGSLIPGVSEPCRALILAFMSDMEIGANVSPSSKKGARSCGRLRNLKSKLQTLAILIHKHAGVSCFSELECRDADLLRFFKKLREMAKNSNVQQRRQVRAVGIYVKAFKSFWHWYQRAERKKSRDVSDITIDLDGRDEKPKFNYLTIEDVKKLCNEAKYDYRVMMMFLFDSGIRSPTELMNVTVNDLEWNNKQSYFSLNIREETSKTFGRRIKLLLCSSILREYVQQAHLTGDDPLFRKCPPKVNKYLTYLAYKVLKMGTMEERLSNGKIVKRVRDGLSMYDFRHSSACYWLPRYKSESALKYRFGWKKSEMIHYYTELLGMKDTIEQDDLYVDITKTELEKQISNKGQEIEILEDHIKEQDKKMKEIMDVLKALELEKLLEHKTDIQNPTLA